MTLNAGTKLGTFEIADRIGAGGMGEVYRATDTKLGRDVAIKTLPASLASESGWLSRFEREAKVLAALNHAHIASIYSLDEHDGTLYLAMELVDGETLEQKLKRGPLAAEEALPLALQIAEALEAGPFSTAQHAVGNDGRILILVHAIDAAGAVPLINIIANWLEDSI